MHINYTCEGVDVTLVKPERSRVIAEVYNAMHPGNNIPYNIFEVHRMKETCKACPHVLLVADNEHYCIREIKE